MEPQAQPPKASMESLLRSLQYQLEEHAEPGQPVSVYLYGLAKEVTGEETAKLEGFLKERGLDARVRFGGYQEHPNALEISFARPTRSIHPSLIPLPLILIGGLALIGVVAFAGVSFTQSVSKNLPLIIGAVAAVAALYVYSNRRET